MRAAAVRLVLVGSIAACAPPVEPVTVQVAATPADAEGPPPRVERPPTPHKAAVLLGPTELGAFVSPASTLSQPYMASAVPDVEANTLRARLTARVRAEGGGMTLDVGPVAGRFQEHDVLELPLTLTPGKCYAIIAVSSGAIEQLRVELGTGVTVTNWAPVQLAESNTVGPDATLGRDGTCFKNPMPIPLPALVRVRAVKGAGLAAAQALSR